MIIFLNGASSVGKSTLARRIMQLSERPFIYYSIDHLVNFWLDEKFVTFDDGDQNWFYHESKIDELGQRGTHIVDGPHAIQLHWDMIESLTVLINKGYDLIIDEVLWQPEIYERYVHALCHSKTVYLVKITCDLIECERREKDRNDRFLGLARGLYTQVYKTSLQYDLEIDTTYNSPEECARSVLDYVQHHPLPHAFLASLKSLISFAPLQLTDMPLLQQWLNAPHLAQEWGQERHWTLKAVTEKYQSYVAGFKWVNEQKKPIHAFIISCAKVPIGLIQCCQANDFPRDGSIIADLSDDTAALDIMLGVAAYLNKGIGTFVISTFIEHYIWPHFSACVVDPNSTNLAAIRVYQKAGFKIIEQFKEPSVTWMVKAKNP